MIARKRNTSHRAHGTRPKCQRLKSPERFFRLDVFNRRHGSYMLWSVPVERASSLGPSCFSPTRRSTKTLVGNRPEPIAV